MPGMRKHETDAAWGYHDATKHSLESVRSSRHHLDWSNLPRPYKLYASVPTQPLPQELLPSGTPALEAISSVNIPRGQERIPDLKELTTLLQLSAGITKWLPTPGGKMAFRAAACTGALYHIELYLACGQLPDLDAGVYQFGVHDMELRRLRSGDYRATLVEAAGNERAVAEAPVIIVCTSTYWRNAWKYQDRAYRHCFWDSGTILANMLAVASAHGLPARVVEGFVDADVNKLVDVDGEREVALSLVPVGYAPSMDPGPAPAVDRLHLETLPLSKTELDYPAVREMHCASCLISPEEVAAWRGSAQSTPLPSPSANLVPLRPLKPEAMPEDPIEKVIIQRGSCRRFDQAPIPFEALSTILSAATRGTPMDLLDPPGAALNDLYLIVNAADGLASGTYVLHRQQQALELLQAGNFRKQAGHLDLGQALGADAAVNVYFLTDLGSTLERLGNRGYRVAQLDASITAGKLYLAAYALRLGATGLTFFDNDVIKFFSPHAEGKSVMFLMALGVRASRRSR